LDTIARALGVAESTVSMWETGKRFPSPENLVGLAKVLEVPPCKFLLSGESTCQASDRACEPAGDATGC
jgi:transcriptional regulator with XRE-family HTH domain